MSSRASRVPPAPKPTAFRVGCSPSRHRAVAGAFRCRRERTLANAICSSPARGPKTIGFREFVAMAAALMATQALAVDTMLPALPTIAAALAPVQREPQPVDRDRYLAGRRLRAAVLGTAVRSLWPATGAADGAGGVCGRGGADRPVEQLPDAAGLAVRARPGRRQRGRGPLGDPRSVLRSPHGARHVADVHRVPDGAGAGSQSRAADPVAGARGAPSS